MNLSLRKNWLSNIIRSTVDILALLTKDFVDHWVRILARNKT